MPSMVTHAAVGVAAAAAFAPRSVSGYFLPASILCATVQDLDVIGFYFVSPMVIFWGTGGSPIPFSWGSSSAFFFHSSFPGYGGFFQRWFFYLVFFFLVWASHGVLDALTRGGHGAALLWPFDNHRVVFSWTPIRISPIGLSSFFSKRGLNVLESELLWVWLPSFTNLIVRADSLSMPSILPAARNALKFELWLLPNVFSSTRMLTPWAFFGSGGTESMMMPLLATRIIVIFLHGIFHQHPRVPIKPE